MPFKKGDPNLPRTKFGPKMGLLRQKMEIRYFLEKFVKTYAKREMRADLIASTPKTRLQFMNNVLSFVTPHMQAVDVTSLGESVAQTPLGKYTTEELLQMREVARKAKERNADKP